MFDFLILWFILAESYASLKFDGVGKGNTFRILVNLYLNYMKHFVRKFESWGNSSLGCQRANITIGKIKAV